MDQGPAKKKNNFWWPDVSDLDGANQAAKSGGIAFGFIALGYIAALALTFVGWRNPMQPDAASNRTVYLLINLITFGVAAFLAWRTYRRPTLVLCSIALAWILGEFAVKAFCMRLPGNVIGAYWGQILGTVMGIAGIRGAYAMRALGKNSGPSHTR